MTNNIDSDLYKCIRARFPDAILISHPAVRGHCFPLFVVNTYDSGTHIIKFTTEQLCKHNVCVSHIMQDNGIRVPDIDTDKYNDKWFITYKYNPNKTLYEQMHNNAITAPQVFDVYCRIIDTNYAISKIPLDKIGGTPGQPIPNANLPVMEYAQVLKSQFTYKPWRWHIYFALYNKLLSMGRIKLIYNDPQWRNILVNNDNTYDSLIDLDALALANTTVSLIWMLYVYPGYDYDALLDYYEYATHQHVNRKLILGILHNLKHIKKKDKPNGVYEFLHSNTKTR